MINYKEIGDYDSSIDAFAKMYNPWYQQAEGTGSIGPSQKWADANYKKKKDVATTPAATQPATATEEENWDINYPEQWNTANDWLTNFLKEDGGQADKIGYTPVAAPGIWGDVTSAIQEMLQGGNAVNTEDIYNTQKAVGMRDLEETAKQMAEQFDVGGLRFSTPLQANITRESGRLSENLAAQQAQAEISAQENARSRMMQAMGLGTAQGSAEGGFGLANAGNQLSADAQNAQNQLSTYGNQMGAANSLIGLGSNYAQLPLQVAGSMDQLGQSLYGQDAAETSASQMNPWLQYALGLSGQSASGIPQTYQPSTWTQLLGGLGGSLPYLQQILSGNKGTTGSFDPTALIQDYLRKQSGNDYSYNWGDADF